MGVRSELMAQAIQPFDFLLKPFDFLMIAIGVPCGSFWFPFDVPVKPFDFLLLPCVGTEFSTPPQQGQENNI